TACIAFELITGDYLFEPKSDAEGQHSRNEDHLALMIELLIETDSPGTRVNGVADQFRQRTFPHALLSNKKVADLYFNEQGKLLRISKLEPWGLASVLNEKYGLTKPEAELFASFLLPMLQLDPRNRISAGQLVSHPWLKLSSKDVFDIYSDEVL